MFVLVDTPSYHWERGIILLFLGGVSALEMLIYNLNDAVFCFVLYIKERAWTLKSNRHGFEI